MDSLVAAACWEFIGLNRLNKFVLSRARAWQRSNQTHFPAKPSRLSDREWLAAEKSSEVRQFTASRARGSEPFCQRPSIWAARSRSPSRLSGSAPLWPERGITVIEHGPIPAGDGGRRSTAQLALDRAIEHSWGKKRLRSDVGER